MLSFKGRVFLQRKVAKSARMKRLAESVQGLYGLQMWYQTQAEVCSSFVVCVISSLQQIRSLHIINHNRCHCTGTLVAIPVCWKLLVCSFREVELHSAVLFSKTPESSQLLEKGESVLAGKASHL